MFLHFNSLEPFMLHGLTQASFWEVIPRDSWKSPTCISSWKTYRRWNKCTSPSVTSGPHNSWWKTVCSSLNASFLFFFLNRRHLLLQRHSKIPGLQKQAPTFPKCYLQNAALSYICRDWLVLIGALIARFWACVSFKLSAGCLTILCAIHWGPLELNNLLVHKHVVHQHSTMLASPLMFLASFS